MSKVSDELREAEERETFLYFFTVLIIFMFLLGGWFLVEGLAATSNGIKQNFWGIYTLAVGFGVIGLSSFPTFYKDRYRVTAMGMILSIFGYLYSVFAAPQEIPNMAKGILIMFIGGVSGGYIYYLNQVGWDMVRGNKKRFVGLIILLGVFLVLWGLLANAYPNVLS